LTQLLPSYFYHLPCSGVLVVRERMIDSRWLATGRASGAPIPLYSTWSSEARAEHLHLPSCVATISIPIHRSVICKPHSLPVSRQQCHSSKDVCQMKSIT